MSQRLLELTFQQQKELSEEIQSYYGPDGWRCITVDENNCHIWTANNGSNQKTKHYYPNMYIKHLKIQMPCHQLVYFLKKTHIARYPMVISHLCHNKRCTNIEHLSRERQQVNAERTFCRQRFQSHGTPCKGHLNKADCVLF